MPVFQAWFYSWRILESVFAVGVIDPSVGADERLVERADFKVIGFGNFAVGDGELVIFEIGFASCLGSGEVGEDIVDFCCGEGDRHHTAVEHILAEDAGEVLGDNEVDVVIFKHPRRMFAG